MTTVCAVMARSYTSTMFDDLDVPAHTRTYDKQSGVTTLAFAGVLDGATETAIRERMTSKNDADQEARANLRTLLAAAETGDLEDIRALTVAAMRYWLGETP